MELKGIGGMRNMEAREILYIMGSILGCWSYAYLMVTEFPLIAWKGYFWFLFPIIILLIDLGFNVLRGRNKKKLGE